MSRNLEWVYKSNGTELTTPTFSTKLDSAYSILDDGTYIWVSCGTDGILVYQYFGASTDDEPDWASLDATNLQRYTENSTTAKLRLVTAIKITATAVQRTTVISSLSLIPDLSTTADGTYTVSGQSVTVLTASSGERMITTSVARSGNALDAKFICTDGTYIYVSNGLTFSEVARFNIAAQDFVDSIFMSVPVSSVYPKMNSNLCYSNGRLWAVAAYYDDTTPQALVSYNLTTAALTSTNLPVRPGSARAWVADGFNGYLYVAMYNSWGVCKVSTSGAYSSYIRVNGYPTGVFTDSSKKIYVSSYGGMLSLIDWSTDAVSNNWGTESKLLSFNVDIADSSYVWFVNSSGNVVKQNLNDGTQIEIGIGTDDWIYTSTRLVQYANGVTLSATPSGTYQLNQNIVSNSWYDGVNTYNTEFILKKADGSATLVENVDYTVNKTSGVVTFLSTSTIITTTTSLKAYYYYKSWYANSALVTPAKTYSSSGGSVSVLPYIFIISNNMLFSIRLDSYFSHLQASTGVTGQGAVVIGSNQYFGE